MTIKLPKFIATSVVRGSQQGESHGGVFTVDFETQECVQHVDWNTGEIDFEGRGADRGLRGVTFDEGSIYIAASDELYQYDRNFNIRKSFRNRYLQHCHEICRMERTIFLTSTGFDSLLVFDLDRQQFTWAFQIQRKLDGWTGARFDPRTEVGPTPTNNFHINMVHVDNTGIYLSGLHTGALLRISSEYKVSEICNLPVGTHNAQPYRDGVLFNDTVNDSVRHVGREGQSRAFKIVTYDEKDIQFAGIDDSKIARQGFGRGLCSVGDRFVAGGSSPSTVSLYDIDSNRKVASVNMTMDIRNAIHGLEPWPYQD
jgi:hypothetical protein